jgi:structure-specific recognition protein 1
MTAYMLWLQDIRSTIKADNPGISVTDVSKKAGAMWKTLSTVEKKVL